MFSCGEWIHLGDVVVPCYGATSVATAFGSAISVRILRRDAAQSEGRQERGELTKYICTSTFGEHHAASSDDAHEKEGWMNMCVF